MVYPLAEMPGLWYGNGRRPSAYDEGNARRKEARKRAMGVLYAAAGAHRASPS